MESKTILPPGFKPAWFERQAYIEKPTDSTLAQSDVTLETSRPGELAGLN